MNRIVVSLKKMQEIVRKHYESKLDTKFKAEWLESMNDTSYATRTTISTNQNVSGIELIEIGDENDQS